MAHVLIIHAVHDDATWKQFFDAAKAFFESPQLVEIRWQAGVEAPAFHDLLQLEAGTL